jgi:hypothetical protein
MVFNSSRRQLPLLQQVGLIGAQMLRSKLVRRLAEVLGEPLDETQIVPDRRVGVITARVLPASWCVDGSQAPPRSVTV